MASLLCYVLEYCHDQMRFKEGSYIDNQHFFPDDFLDSEEASSGIIACRLASDPSGHDLSTGI